jgi:hypothetical protein
MSFNQNTAPQPATVVKKENLFKAKWLSLNLITYIDEFGVRRVSVFHYLAPSLTLSSLISLSLSIN